MEWNGELVLGQLGLLSLSELARSGFGFCYPVTATHYSILNRSIWPGTSVEYLGFFVPELSLSIFVLLLHLRRTTRDDDGRRLISNRTKQQLSPLFALVTHHRRLGFLIDGPRKGSKAVLGMPNCPFVLPTGRIHDVHRNGPDNTRKQCTSLEGCKDVTPTL